MGSGTPLAAIRAPPLSARRGDRRPPVALLRSARGCGRSLAPHRVVPSWQIPRRSSRPPSFSRHGICTRRPGKRLSRPRPCAAGGLALRFALNNKPSSLSNRRACPLLAVKLLAKMEPPFSGRRPFRFPPPRVVMRRALVSFVRHSGRITPLPNSKTTGGMKLWPASRRRPKTCRPRAASSQAAGALRRPSPHSRAPASSLIVSICSFPSEPRALLSMGPYAHPPAHV